MPTPARLHNPRMPNLTLEQIEAQSASYRELEPLTGHEDAKTLELRARRIAHLRALVEEGLASGPGEPDTPELWQELDDIASGRIE
jgi:hypothetical protein